MVVEVVEKVTEVEVVGMKIPVTVKGSRAEVRTKVVCSIRR